MAISTKNLDQSLRDEWKKQYFTEIFHSCSDNEIPKWLPRRCDNHKAFDRRKTGLYKLELSGKK